MIKHENKTNNDPMNNLARNYCHLTDEPIIIGEITKAVCGYIGKVRSVNNLPICPSCQMIEDTLND